MEDLRKDKTRVQPRFRWLWVEREPLRVYPGRELAAPLVGFVDSLENGSAGLEKVLDRDLRGSSFRVLVEQDRRGYSVGVGLEESRTARDGRSVRLTLDASVQAATEAALLKAVEASRPEAAMAVVMEVRTGAVLAVANYPAGNPNDVKSRGVKEGELFKNHAVLDQIEPGSVMKPFVIAAAMNEGITRPEERIDCMMGRWAIGDKVIKDDHEKGVITLTQVLKYSSNIGTAVVGMRLGPERLVRYLKDFGFGRKSGLGFPGESPGALRNPQQARPIEIATMSFGQGMTASPVQLAAAMSALGNDGMRMHPYLVDGTVESGVLTRSAPREDRQAVSPEIARTTLAMMETVLDAGGTGTRARVAGYRVAGKTGTAQKVENGVYSPTKRISSFVGLLPADRPEIAIAISVDTPTVGSKYGGLVAGPVFSEVGAFSMRYFGIPESAPATEPVPGDVVDPAEAAAAAAAAARPPAPKPPPPRADPLPPLVLRTLDGAWRMPDLQGRSLREATQVFERAGMHVRATGTGQLIQQRPAPGQPLSPDTVIELQFR
jgi:cell division protein FtsI (penicillin-binding protein 3)